MAAEQGFGSGLVGCYGTLPGPLSSHINSSSLDKVYNPIPVIAIAIRYNICGVSLCLYFAETYWKLDVSLLFVQYPQYKYRLTDGINISSICHKIVNS